MSKPSVDFFTADAAKGYDERNRKLAPIQNCLHFLLRLVLRDLPTRARILSVGAGTGAEILSLADVFPEWTFVALDPSASMLEVCRTRIEERGLTKRCKFVVGVTEDLPVSQEFDAALSMLVAHFIKPIDRLNFYRNIADRLKPGGLFVNAEISCDMKSDEFPLTLKNWEAVQDMMGATPESLAKLPQVLTDVLTVLAPVETEALLRQSGIALPIRFFQASMICGWFGQR